MRKIAPPRPSYSERHKTSVRSTKPPVILQKTRAILALRCLGGLGDMLMLTPALRGIKEQNPNLPLIVCTTPKYPPLGSLFDILKNNPYIDKAIGLEDLSKYDFTKTYNFQTNEETHMEQIPTAWSSNRIDIFCELAQVNPSSRKPVYIVTACEADWAERWLSKIPATRRGKLFGIHVSASVPRRNWPREKVLLLNFLLVNKYPDSSVLLFEDTQYQTPFESHPNIYHVKNMPIRQVGALIEKCDVMIVPDSFLLHLSGALDKKIVGIFGSTPPESRLSHYDKSLSVVSGVDCSPCWYERCYKNFKCLTSVSVEMVMDGVKKVLEDQFEQFGKFHEKGLCVIRMGGVGDLIMLSSALQALKQANPDLDITLATLPPHVPLFKRAPYLKGCVSIPESSKMVFDKVIDLRWKVESPQVGGTLDSEVYKTKNRVDIFETLVGVRAKEKRFEIDVDPKSVLKVKEMLGEYPEDKKWVGVQVTCTSNLRTIPPEYILPLLELLKRPDFKIVLFGKSEFWHGRKSSVNLEEIKAENVVNLMNKTNLKELIALCELMDFIIAPDSAAVHIAAALKKKCLALFGNINPYTRTFYYPTVKALYPEGELDCIPCHDFKNPCEHYKHMPTTTQPVGAACMRLLTPRRIFEVAREWFDL